MLDVALLGRCVQRIVQRHEVLRTVLANDGDRPLQQALPLTAPALQLVDLRHLARHLRDEEVGLRVGAEAGYCFNLAAEALLRVTLLRLDRQDHIFVFVAHQAVCDGRSLDLFYRELEALYANGGAAEGASLAELPVQYGDYALWQRRGFDDAALAAPLAYWKKQLGGVLPVLDLPADKPRAAAASLKGARQKIILDRALTAGLKELSARRVEHTVRYLDGGVQRLALALHAAGRSRCRVSRWPIVAIRRWRSHRLVRQYPGAAQRSLRRSDIYPHCWQGCGLTCKRPWPIRSCRSSG